MLFLISGFVIGTSTSKALQPLTAVFNHSLEGMGIQKAMRMELVHILTSLVVVLFFF